MTNSTETQGTAAAAAASSSSSSEQKTARALTLAERIKANAAARKAQGTAAPAKGASQHKSAKRGKARTAKVRAGWKLGTPKAANGRTGDNECLCGCGTLVKNRFAQGHDARVHGWLAKVETEDKPFSSLPAILQRAVRSELVVFHPKTARIINAKTGKTVRTKTGKQPKGAPKAPKAGSLAGIVGSAASAA